MLSPLIRTYSATGWSKRPPGFAVHVLVNVRDRKTEHVLSVCKCIFLRVTTSVPQHHATREWLEPQGVAGNNFRYLTQNMPEAAFN